MAKCKKCGAEIQEGSEFCESCLSKENTAKDSESYLDGLLDSVMTKEPLKRETVFRKKKTGSPVLMSEDSNQGGKAPEPPAGYSIFDEADEDEIDRMLMQNLSTEEKLFVPENEKSPMDEKKEEAPEATEPNEVTEDISSLQDQESDALYQIFSDTGSQQVFPEKENEEEKDTTFPVIENEVPEQTKVEEPPEEILSAAKMPVETENQVETKQEVTEEPFPTELTEQSDPGDAVVDQDLIELLSGFSDGENGLFEFGAGEGNAESEKKEEQIENNVVSESSESGQEVKKKQVKGKKKKEKKKGLFHRLFDNVKLDENKIKHAPTKEEIEEKKRAEKEAKEKSKEEKETLLAEKKEEDKKNKAEKQQRIREAKEEKKARKLEEAKLLLEEMESTRINRAGASIIFIFFAMIAVVIIVGTSIFSYSLSIKNAEYEFNRDEYTAAYNEIFGLDVKDEDIVLYDRIMTVMYVQKQLNSYYNYYELKQYPQALDSLLKGLQRYEKYIELAISLDIEDDMDNVRGSELDQSAGKKSILGEIYSTFSLTEQEAMDIIQSKNRAEYSKKVYDAVDNMKLLSKDEVTE